ncbi:MAG: protein kinase [Myxococcaceae bacterium]
MAELEFKIEGPEQRVVAFPSRAFVIGSDSACALCFKSELVAPRHAEIVKDERGQWWVRDLVGNGAVSVNNQPVIDERLSSGDKLRIGDVLLTIQDTGVNAHARTRSGDAIPAVQRRSGPLAPQSVIDSRYRILGKIAEGGMGEVYKAEHVELGKQLAIKVMLPELSSDAEFVGRFKREAVASSRIGHPNIIDISDFGQTPDGRFYFVMEFVEGKTLVKYRKEGAFRFERIVHVGLQIARALASAHAVSIIHRDLKPENIMLVQRPGQPDFVKVLDFGIAKVLGSGASGAFTAVGSVVGTPQYMSPEQATAGVIDARSDIYALGLILHELVRGRPTFDGDSAVELMSRQIDTMPPALKSPWGTVPPALDRIIMQMLQKLPEERPASMEAVITALEAVASTPTPTRTEPITAVDLPSLPPAAAAGKTPPVQATNLGVLTPPELPAPTQNLPPRPSPARNITMPPPGETRLEKRTDGAGVVPAVQPVARGTQAPARQPESAVDLAAVRPNRTPLLIGLLLVIGVLIGAVAWTFRPTEETPPIKVVTTGPVTPTPTPTPTPVDTAPAKPDDKPPPAGTIKLTLEAVPDRVEVYEDDILLGMTPITISRPQATVTALRFELRGYAPLTRKVRFESDTALKVELQKDGKPQGGTASTGTGKKPRPPDGDDLKDSPF